MGVRRRESQVLLAEICLQFRVKQFPLFRLLHHLFGNFGEDGVTIQIAVALDAEVFVQHHLRKPAA